MAGQTFRRGFHYQPTGVVLKYMKGGQEHGKYSYTQW